MLGKHTCFFLLLCALASCRNKPLPEKEAAERMNKTFAPALDAYFAFKIDKAIYLYDSIYGTLQSPPVFFTTLRYSFLFTLHGSKPLKAATYMDSVIGLYESHDLVQNYPESYANACMQNGTLFFNLGLYEKSYDYYFKAKNIADHYFTACAKAGYDYQIGMVQYRQKKYAQAVRSFAASLAANIRCPDQNSFAKNRQQELEDNIGLCYSQLGQYDSAICFFRQAIATAEQNTDPKADQRLLEGIKGVVYGNLARVYAKQHREDSAVALLKTSIYLNSKPYHDQYDLQFVQAQLAGLYHQQKAYPAMQGVLDSLKEGLDSLPNNDALLQWKQLMYRYWQASGNQSKALHFYESYIHQKDSADKAKAASLETDITRLLKEREQQLQIDLLKKDNQISRLYLWIAVALSAMAMLVITLVYTGYRRGKKNLRALQLLNAEVNRQKEFLEKANREKDRILHVVAHDLRSPVGIAAYAADLLLMDDAEDAKEEYAGMIKQASGQAIALINELLGTQTAAITGKKERVNLNACIKESIRNIQHKAAAKDLQLVFRETGNLAIAGVESRIDRLLMNLLDNAIKFSGKHAAITVRAARTTQEQALVTVQDTGIGIPYEKQSRIFDVFTTARQQGTMGESSHGLGLSICKQIAEEHGGSIRVESTPGKGTTFYILLPLSNDLNNDV